MYLPLRLGRLFLSAYASVSAPSPDNTRNQTGQLSSRFAGFARVPGNASSERGDGHLVVVAASAVASAAAGSGEKPPQATTGCGGYLRG